MVLAIIIYYMLDVNVSIFLKIVQDTSCATEWHVAREHVKLGAQYYGSWEAGFWNTLNSRKLAGLKSILHATYSFKSSMMKEKRRMKEERRKERKAGRTKGQERKKETKKERKKEGRKEGRKERRKEQAHRNRSGRSGHGPTKFLTPYRYPAGFMAVAWVSVLLAGHG